MLSKVREKLALGLIALLPLHALLVTILTTMIGGTGLRPLISIAVWKEVWLGVLIAIALVEVIKQENEKFKVDALDWCMLIAFVDAGVQLVWHPLNLQVLLGFKYDLLPLIAFFFLRRVDWSDRFRESAKKILLVMGAIVAVYGLITLLVPMSFFTWLGYSDLHSLYVPHGSLAAFQQIGGTAIRRIQSTMSGPNQLGLWLLIPVSIVMEAVMKRKKVISGQWVVGSVMIAALLMTFSRAAWIAAAVMTIVAIVESKKFSTAQFAAGIASMGVLGALLLVLFPSVVIRTESSAGHIEKPIAAFLTMKEHPLGLGLGAAGPASNAVSDVCVEQPKGADISWVTSRHDLCVFIEGAQVYPTERRCDCPLLTENWYLQWGVEMGWAGLILSLIIVVLVLRKLRIENGEWRIGLAFLGASVAGLFLHSFEDAAVAYTLWILASSHLDSRVES